MNKRMVSGIFAVLLVAGIAVSGFAQDLGKIQGAVNGLSGDLAKALPFNSTLGLNWSDAYIGEFPHFGVGLAAGVTTLDMASIKGAVEAMNTSFPLDMARMILPAYTLEGRVGLPLSLPLDVGLKFGILPNISVQDIKLDYLMVGGDVRYAILDGVANPAFPNLSVGLGVNYLKGGVGVTFGENQRFTYFTDTFELSQPELNLNWNTVTLELKAQISKTILFFTPYLGVGGSYAWSGAGYTVDANVKLNGKDITQADIDRINNTLASYGYEKIDASADGISSLIKSNNFNCRVYCGTSINLGAFRLDLTGLFNILDQNFGGSLGLRFQM